MMRNNTPIKSFLTRLATVAGTLVAATTVALTGAPSAGAFPADGATIDCGGGRPGACPGWPPGPGKQHPAAVPLMCDGRVPGICPYNAQ
jgi:hypothetical protein